MNAIILLLFIIALGGFGSPVVGHLAVACIIAFVSLIWLFAGVLCLLLPFMAYYAFRNWRDRKEQKRLATDPAYRAYKHELALREEARCRMIDKRIAERVKQAPARHQRAIAYKLGVSLTAVDDLD